MLHQFLATNRAALIQRCRAKVDARSTALPLGPDLGHGIPLFLDQLADTLRAELETPRDGDSTLPDEISRSAGTHGSELFEKGFSVDQVVHGYGDLCQSVTELAGEQGAPITVDEFRTFNRCLDDAIADAVTEFSRRRERQSSTTDASNATYQELRTLVRSAILAFEAIKTGNVAITGATSGVLDRSLVALREIIDVALA